MTKWIATCVMTMAVAVGAVAQQQDAVPKELAPLQGTWVVTDVNGSAPPAQMALTFTGAKYAETIDGTIDETGTIKVDNSKTPATFDLIIAEGDSAGQTQLGIIEIKGDFMRCLMNAPGSGARPTSFDKEDGELFVVLQKKK
jgi:uncharacterized protein (TIGR03067 family)